MESFLRISARLGSLAVMVSALLVACGHDGNRQVFTDDKISDIASPDLIVLESMTYLQTSSDLVGAPGTDVLAFAAGDQGAGVLRLEYIRGFDEPVVPDRVSEFILRIDGSRWPPAEVTVPPTSTAEGLLP